jgi:hypothetical protein
VKDLWAAQDEWVGTVEICADTVNSVLSVTFDVSGSGLCLHETHVYANTGDPSAPPPQGAPGRFPFKHEGISAGGCEAVDAYMIDGFALGCDETAALAAHAVVCAPAAELDLRHFVDLVEIEAGAAGRVMTRVSHRDGASALDVEILDGEAFTGLHDGWFIDLDRAFSPRTVYSAVPVSSYVMDESGTAIINPAAAELVEYPDNLDAVNWLINQQYPGRSSMCGGSFTEGDVQRAIWELVEDEQSTEGIGSWSRCRVREIVSAATDYGRGYVPGCDGSMVVILNPVDAMGQNVARIAIAEIELSELEVLCDTSLRGCETAWGQALGGDIPFPRGGGWGSYFEYTCE